MGKPSWLLTTSVKGSLADRLSATQVLLPILIVRPPRIFCRTFFVGSPFPSGSGGN